MVVWMRKALAATTAVTVLIATAAPAVAQPVLTPHQAHSAAKIALESSLGSLIYRGVGTADTAVGHCRVHGRRGTCPARITGTVTCDVRVRILVTGAHPAAKDADLLVWADRVSCH